MGPLPKRKKTDHFPSESDDAPKKRQFQKPVTFSSEDHFSNLPVECIDSVFSFLDQVDLDCIAHISQTINHYVTLSRSEVPRSTLFAYVELRQNSLNEFRLNLSGNDDGIFTYVSASGRPLSMSDHINRYRQNKEDFGEEGESFDKIRVPHQILRQIVFAAQRFELREIELNKILIDESVIEHMKWFNTKKLTIVDGELEEIDEYESFLDGLLAGKIKKISLRMRSVFAIIDVDFIKRMSQNVEYPSLEVRDYVCEDFVENEIRDLMTVMDKSTHEALPFFKNLKHPLMQANADWIMQTLMMRISKKRNGDWELGCSRTLTLKDISMGVEAHHEIAHHEDCDVTTFTIKTTTRSKSVILATIYTRATEIRVRFNKH